MKSATIDDEFITFIMYLPPGGNSTYVPVGELPWSFSTAILRHHFASIHY